VCACGTTIRCSSSACTCTPISRGGRLERDALVALTFDLDLVDYVAGEPAIEELTVAVPALLDILDERQCPATWFVRLDAHTRAVHGDAEFIFRHHAGIISRLLARGDEIGWHLHSYRQSDGGQWKANTDVQAVLADLAAHAPLARARGLRAVRMGWGFHTNETMRFIADAGFEIDSSAIPRPRYPWDEGTKDWAVTPLMPYRPSSADYRIPGEPSLPLVEIPMSVAAIAAHNDTQEVLRYVNPAFIPHALANPVRSWFGTHDLLVTVTHPYELLRRRSPHPLLAGSLDAFAANVDAIAAAATRTSTGAAFVTLSDVAARIGTFRS
jgi:peptidoglycan/xylan/chitin deacetylase (PgdA/CDA1 family)